MTRRYITIKEAAEYLSVSDHTIRRLIADGEFTGYRIGRQLRARIRFDLNEVDEKLMRPTRHHSPTRAGWRNDPRQSGETGRSEPPSRVLARGSKASRAIPQGQPVRRGTTATAYAYPNLANFGPVRGCSPMSRNRADLRSLKPQNAWSGPVSTPESLLARRGRLAKYWRFVGHAR
jgi:excisionase family DNA binding protein